MQLSLHNFSYYLVTILNNLNINKLQQYTLTNISFKKESMKFRYPFIKLKDLQKEKRVAFNVFWFLQF